MRAVVRGDDFTVLGHSSALDWFRKQISERFEVKFRGRIGPDGGERGNIIRILSRIVEWKDEGIEYEPDQRHAEIIVQELGLEHSKEVRTPGVKESRKDSAEEHELDKERATTYRRLVAR